jgi:catechol 2,3-dioxygenase-like lactoylglutathione lyase family enzyme
MPKSATLDHVTIITGDFEASRRVYDGVLGALGLVATMDYEDPEGDSDDTGTVAAIGYSSAAGEPRLWLVAGLEATSGAHVALAVTERGLVERAHAAAQQAGARIVQPPREWESAQLNYYGTQIGDLAGNIVEIVFRAPGAVVASELDARRTN